MKKFLLLFLCLFIFTGCGKVNEKDVVKKLEKQIDNTDSYLLEGNMQIISNEDTYNYSVEVSFLDGDYYKVKLLNVENNHEQIILKNEEGVYVITPALNKSFKFQSEWPNNSSQTYILESIVKDIKNDSERTYEEKNGDIIITSKVNYPNNSDLVSQKVVYDKDMKLKKLDVLNSNGVSQISMTVTKLNLKAKLSKEEFALSNNVDKECCEEKTTNEEIDSVIYPMYLPTGTTYQKEEKVNVEDNERVILTYSGEKPFIMIEEMSTPSKELEVTTVNGELITYGNLVGVMTDTSFNWTENGMEYYLIGSNLSEEEILQIASSTQVVAYSK